ncbi:MAG: DHH family phosphoesterase [Oscillospiraceae bacterium]|nr:DHH family phosphoesterase [Oscillospiraceae bacterium]
MNDFVGINLEDVADWFRQRDDFLVLTHRKPDGDTIGSAGGLVQGLRDFGKNAYILYNTEITPRYEPFLSEYWAAEDYVPKHIISVDTATTELFPVNGDVYKESIALSIDHHPTNTFFSEHTWLEPQRAACGEMIYELLINLNASVGEKVANNLYIAISTDTGCFAYTNTTADSLRIAAYLIEAGAMHNELNKTLFRTFTKSRIMLEGMIYSGLEFHFDGNVAISTISQQMLEESAATDDDTDGIAAIPGSIEDVVVGITIRESIVGEECRISLRSTEQINSADVCARFGGGGHAAAAGCTIAKPIDEAKKALLEVLGEYFP